MRKRVLRMLLLLCLVCALPMQVFAETYTGEEGWGVTFTPEEKMESNFRTGELTDLAQGLQPGDNMIITLTLKNTHPTTTHWYMTNKVLRSLEDSAAAAKSAGGAYTYRLVYTDKSGAETVLYDSEQVGGEAVSPAGEGLHEATSALEDYFYLDTLAQGQSGSILLEVALEGETQGNWYQDTLADLQMNFAVELDTTGTTTRTRNIRRTVKTGDYLDIVPYVIAAAASGLLLLILGFILVKRRRNEERGA